MRSLFYPLLTLTVILLVGGTLLLLRPEAKVAGADTGELRERYV
ncbi:exported hypothetical protein [Candidatus Sulfopaludibacter sp. SbA6]|nr:exported hypothetical protein [Candidatus Sulfopaludibacter sp. SbA6]